MPTLIGRVPLFDFFATYHLAISRTEQIQPSLTPIGTLASVSDIDALVPAAHWRIEIEREEGAEEVRVVNGYTGEYHSATGEAANPLIAELDRRLREIYRPDQSAFPDGVDIDEKGQAMWTSIISYDGEAERILPAITYRGEADDAAFERISVRGTTAWFVDEDFVGVVDRRTGDVWKASEQHGKALREKIEGSACYRAAMERAEGDKAERG